MSGPAPELINRRYKVPINERGTTAKRLCGLTDLPEVRYIGVGRPGPHVGNPAGALASALRSGAYADFVAGPATAIGAQGDAILRP